MLKKQKPLTLSIIIPVFNEQNYLADCLDAIASQSVKPDEVIVVDNNSSDDSLQIARSYPFVKLVSERRQGIVYARNRGFAAARSDLICRIDADSLLPKNWVESVFNAYEQNPGAVITGRSYYRNGLFFGKKPIFIDAFYYGFSRLLLGHHTLFGSNMVIPKSAWLDVKSSVCESSQFHEDTDLSVHLAANYKIIKCSSVICGVVYRMNEKPGGMAKYIYKWFQTVRHGWKVNPITGFSPIFQLKNKLLVEDD